MQAEQAFARRALAQARFAGGKHDKLHAVEILCADLFGGKNAVVFAMVAQGIDLRLARPIGPGKGQPAAQGGMHLGSPRPVQHLAKAARLPGTEAPGYYNLFFDEESMCCQVQIAMLATFSQEGHLTGLSLFQLGDAAAAGILRAELCDRGHFRARGGQGAKMDRVRA